MPEKGAPKVTTFSSNQLEVAIAPDQYQRQCVALRLLGFEEMAGMTPGNAVVLALYPSEARALAHLLVQKADEIEASASSA